MNGHKAAFAAALILFAATGVAAAQRGEDKPLTLALFVNGGSFKASGVDADGTQNIGYAQLIYTTSKWGAGVTTSYAATDYLTSTSHERFTRSSMTDTAITTFYNIQSGQMRARFGVDFGLPTGKATQTAAELVKNIADDISQDLLMMNSYGSGLNVAPHLALSYGMGAWTWGLGARYLVAGSYDPMSDRNRDVFDPGDSLMLVLSAMATLNEESSLLVNLSRVIQDKDKQDGREIFRNGDITSVEIRYIREWAGDISTALVGAMRQQDKNQRIYEGTKYKVETGNANANAMETYLEMAQKRSRRLTLTGVVGFKSVQANNYKKEDYLYDGGRTKIFLEPGVRWSFGEDKMLSLKARYSSIDDKADVFSPGGATYSVTNLDLGVIMSF
ncbi:MAG: hypothetical protein OEV92_05420 [Nitrospinota bacterium]|nr:hypothetical protein [Nitrospinota bacterium]